MANTLYGYLFSRQGICSKRFLCGSFHALVGSKGSDGRRISVASFDIRQSRDMPGLHSDIGHILGMHIYILSGNVPSAEVLHKSSETPEVGFCFHLGITDEDSFTST